MSLKKMLCKEKVIACRRVKRIRSQVRRSRTERPAVEFGKSEQTIEREINTFIQSKSVFMAPYVLLL